VLKLSIVNRTVSELAESAAYLKTAVSELAESAAYLNTASQVALLMQIIQFLVMVSYLVNISIMTCKVCVERKCTEQQEEQIELMESRLQDRRSLRRAAKTVSQ
jgi:hypothetical protein